jgi:hypothetical protein
MEERDQDPGSEIYRQDQNKQVQVGDMQIIGSWGSQVVIGGSNVQAVQIAGDSVSGDVYHIVSRSEQGSFEQMLTAALRQELPEEQRQVLEQVLQDLGREIAKGKEANESWLNYLFSAIGKISLETLALVTHWVWGNRDLPKKIRVLARSAMPRERR